MAGGTVGGGIDVVAGVGAGEAGEAVLTDAGTDDVGELVGDDRLDGV
jgi:hypothetical protein